MTTKTVHDHHADGANAVTAVLHVGNLHWGSEKAVAEALLKRLPGVLRVDANPVAQTATVTYDRSATSVAVLRKWVEDCGYHCAGQSVPGHVCAPMQEPGQSEEPGSHADHGSVPAMHPAGHGESTTTRSPHEAMGHGGHAGMSMASMVADMRRRFLVAAVLSIPILLWSPIGRDVLNFNLSAPFGLRDDVFQLILSIPVVFWAGWIFFDGAARALRARTLDMMVLVAVAVAAGWLYSLVVTLTGGGEVFYEAASVLATFVLLGHWFEMRARGGANEAIRALIDLAPPMATVLRDGKEVEIPTAEDTVGDPLLIRPGAKVAVDGVVEEGVGTQAHESHPALHCRQPMQASEQVVHATSVAVRTSPCWPSTATKEPAGWSNRNLHSTMPSGQRMPVRYSGMGCVDPAVQVRFGDLIVSGPMQGVTTVSVG